MRALYVVTGNDRHYIGDAYQVRRGLWVGVLDDEIVDTNDLGIPDGAPIFGCYEACRRAAVARWYQQQ